MLQWNQFTGNYEGMTSDGRFSVEVDGDEFEDTLDRLGEDAMQRRILFSADVWYECYPDNRHVTVFMLEELGER